MLVSPSFTQTLPRVTDEIFRAPARVSISQRAGEFLRGSIQSGPLAKFNDG